jgi:hypothetical protein
MASVLTRLFGGMPWEIAGLFCDFPSVTSSLGGYAERSLADINQGN